MEDEDLELFEEKRSFKKWYITNVFKKYGIVYGIIALITFLCNIILLIPAAIGAGIFSVEKNIILISGGDKVTPDCYWAYLIVSLVGIIAIWATIKICDKVFEVKKTSK